jgi:hypothetical protein
MAEEAARMQIKRGFIAKLFLGDPKPSKLPPENLHQGCAYGMFKLMDLVAYGFS